MSQLDFANVNAPRNSGDVRQSGANTLITLNASDSITWQGLTAAGSTSQQSGFV